MKLGEKNTAKKLERKIGRTRPTRQRMWLLLLYNTHSLCICFRSAELTEQQKKQAHKSGEGGENKKQKKVFEAKHLSTTLVYSTVQFTTRATRLGKARRGKELWQSGQEEFMRRKK